MNVWIFIWKADLNSCWEGRTVTNNLLGQLLFIQSYSTWRTKQKKIPFNMFLMHKITFTCHIFLWIAVLHLCIRFSYSHVLMSAPKTRFPPLISLMDSGLQVWASSGKQDQARIRFIAHITKRFYPLKYITYLTRYNVCCLKQVHSVLKAAINQYKENERGTRNVVNKCYHVKWKRSALLVDQKRVRALLWLSAKEKTVAALYRNTSDT